MPHPHVRPLTLNLMKAHEKGRPRRASSCLTYRNADAQADHLEQLAPFFAYKVLGDSFKWMFIGEDDTLFFRQGALKAVEGADAEMLYLISGRASQSSICQYRIDTISSLLQHLRREIICGKQQEV